MDKDDAKDASTIFVFVWFAAVVIWLSALGLVKLTEKAFPAGPYAGASYQEVQALKQCAAAHGTPILENNGEAYKACAINGRSATRNVVK